MNRNLVVIITLLFALSVFLMEAASRKTNEKVESKKVNSNQLKKVKKQPRKVKGVLLHLVSQSTN